MDLSLNALVEQLDELFFERSTRAFRAAAGIERDAAVPAELPELTRLEAWQVVSEVSQSPRVDDAKRSRVVLLRRHVARAFVEAAISGPAARRDQFLRGQGFFSAAKTWTCDEARRELPRLASREGRVALQADWSATLQANESHAARCLDGAREAIEALGLDPARFVDELHGRPAAERLASAEALLRDTADPHLDLLGYALKKLDPLLSPRVGSEHDARRAAFAPWLLESFRREDLGHAVTRCLGDLGLSQNAEGRLTVDSEPRPGRDPRPRVFEHRVPDQVRLLLTPEPGLEAYAGWLSTWGLGLHRANVNRALPFVERRLGDRALLEAVGVVFESFLLEEGWLKRYLRLTASQAREAARLAAFRQLHRLRRDAALSSYSAEAMQRGASANLGDDFRSMVSRAVAVEVPRGEALFAVDAFGDRLLHLDGVALAHMVRSVLRERFNEDYWRNPATGRWLLELAGRGQREDAVVVSKQLGASGLELAQAAQVLVAVMGA
ncbi:MAG: hypothetical protein U0228_04615 [Myxococcaceae bacterium]